MGCLPEAVAHEDLLAKVLYQVAVSGLVVQANPMKTAVFFQKAVLVFHVLACSIWPKRLPSRGANRRRAVLVTAAYVPGLGGSFLGVGQGEF